MADYTYTFPWIAIDHTGAPMANLSGGEFLDADLNPVAVTTLAGVTTTIQTGPYGRISPIIASVRRGVVRFGGPEGPATGIISDEAMTAGDDAIQARIDAQAARAAAEAVISIAAPVSHIGLGSDGVPFYSDDIVENGGVIVRNQDGTFDAVFPD